MPPTLTSRSDIEKEFEDHAKAIMQLEGDQRNILDQVDKRIKKAKAEAYDGSGNYRGVFDSEHEAECFGLSLMANTHEDKAVRQRCAEALRHMGNHYERDLATGVEGSGGAIVPIEFSSRVKRLVESHGVAVRRLFYMPMSSDQLTFPKQVGELEVFLLSEGVAGEDSDLQIERVTLTAKEVGVLTYYSRNLADDAAVLVGEMIARSILFAFARKVDKIVFNGDGSDTYFGIQGIIPKLKTINGVDDGGSLVLASGNAWSEITLEDFSRVQARLPHYEVETDPVWYMSRRFYYEVCVPLILAAGGVTAEAIEGSRKKLLLGDEVEFVEVMPKVEGNSQVCALYGDMALAGTYGDRRALTVEQSTDFKFAQRTTTVLGVNRFAISIEDLGTATEAGPMIGLITQSS